MILLLLSCLEAFSQSSLKPQLVPDEIFGTPQPKMTQEINVTRKRNSLKILSRYAQSQFKQSGQGTSYETGKSNSLGFLAQHDYLIEDKNLFRTDVIFQPTGFKNPTTNRTQSLTRSLLATHYGWKRQLFSLHTELFTGAVLSHRNAFSDSQNLASTSTSVAPSLGATLNYELNPQISLQSVVFVNSPLWLKESKKTGFFETGFHATLRAGMSLRLSKALRVLVEAMYEQEDLSFSGEGERSVKDARVSYRSLSFPIGVEYEF